MPVTVRKGEERDFPSIIRLIKELAEFEKASDKVKNSLEQMKKEKDSFNFFVAEEDGRLIGTAIYFFAYYTWVGKSLYLDDLYVAPQSRGKKVGSMLLTKIFEVAKKEKCNRVRWQVLDWNKNAIGFYKKRGAVISEEWLNCDFDKEAIEKLLKNNSY